MSFSECFPLAVFMFCLGAALCSLFCVIFGKVFKKRYASSRFVHFCLFFSAAAICAVWALFKSKHYLLETSEYPASDIIYFACILAAGIISARFWKIAIPVFLVAYIAITAYTAVFLYSEFGTSENKYVVTVKSDVIQINGEEFPAGGLNEKQIKFSAYTIPAKLIVPFPKNWYRLESVIDLKTQNVYESQAARTEPKQYNFYQKWVLSSCSEGFLVLPEAQALPAVYDTTLSCKAGEVQCQITRTF